MGKEIKPRFQLDEFVALRERSWIYALMNYLYNEKVSNETFDYLYDNFIIKQRCKIIGIRKKIEVDGRDRYTRKIVDGHEYLVENNGHITSNDEWISEENLIPILSRIEEISSFVDVMKCRITKHIKELSYEKEEKKVVDIEEDDELQLEL
jgi:hypothetical protein